ncbi:glycoside hydrolase family 2 TIM barrel-domain containing protein [Aliikangiella marina]|nr:glycoside hydrolase family 2 TIM barrel-domain containing protein [Aliikangiella marina]
MNPKPALNLLGPSKVEIVTENSKHKLLVDGQPFEVKGAGLNWDEKDKLSALKESGGNTFRTWTHQGAEAALPDVNKLGLMFVMGIELGKELHGFDYDDANAVKEQFEEVKAIVNQYKDNPNLLAWAVANEPNLLFDEKGALKAVNPKVYDAISEIIDYIHEHDPNHPVTYTFAGVLKEHLDVALARTPQVDFVSLQVYGDLLNIPKLVKEAEITKPFMVTEFGPLGHWERPATEWGREIEEPSGIKASSLGERMIKGLRGDLLGLNIGHFVFLWGQKQERTPTWYGMFTKNGYADARVDEMTLFWTGEYPSNRAPNVEALTLNDAEAETSLKLTPQQPVTAKVFGKNLDQPKLEYRWELMKEVSELSQGGAHEEEPETLSIDFISDSSASGSINFSAPSMPGEYRLFVYVYDRDGKVGYANFPFICEQN